MLLSNIIRNGFKDCYKNEVIIKNEHEFDCLGLCYSITGKAMCTFIEDVKYLSKMSSDAVMIVCTEAVAEHIVDQGICITNNPRYMFFLLHNYLSGTEYYLRKPFETQIGENCNISNLSHIDSQNVIIGDNVMIEEFVSIKKNTIIGSNSKIYAGSIIGGMGFEYKTNDREMISVNHSGGVIIGEHVEILQNTVVVRGIYPWDDTIIEDYTKIDDLVHIAHGVKIGNNSFIVANTCVAGRVNIGKHVWIGPGSTIRNGIYIEDNVRVNMGATVTTNLKKGETVSGNFAINHCKYLKFIKGIR